MSDVVSKRQIGKLSEESSLEVFDAMAEGLKQFLVGAELSARRELLGRLVDLFDELDEENEFFGTEGWRESFGIN